MTQHPRPPEGGRRLMSGCRRVGVGLLVVTGAAALFLLRWLWLLARRKRPTESLADTIREAALEVSEEGGERREPGLRRVDLVVGGIVLLGLAFIPLAIWGVSDSLPDISFLTSWRGEPPAPWRRLGRDRAPEGGEAQATQMAQLGSYGWLDEEAGVARIPIDRAMGLLLERGESLARATLPPDATATPAAVVTATTTVTATVAPDAGSAEAGEQLFTSLGCGDCHLADGSGPGPSLMDLFGTQVQLESGETVQADEDYVRRSILHPREQIVSGYQPIMPSFEGELSEQELQDLIAYVRSLSTEAP